MLRVMSSAGRVASASRVVPTLRSGARTFATRAGGASQARHISAMAAFGAVGLGAAMMTNQQAECAFWDGWFGPAAPKGPWVEIQKDIEEIIEDNAAGPLLVRLAWHLSGSYDAASNTGGSNGATMRFHPERGYGANAGLDSAQELLEPLKAKYPDVSYADLYTFAGKVAVEYMGGPTIEWLPGRTDSTEDKGCPPDGRLPDATQGCTHLKNIFGRMGFNVQEIVALSGAHTLGFCHTDRSGFDGPWTEEPDKFDNKYFTLLLEEPWTTKVREGCPVQFKNKDDTLMMLPSDIALISDPAAKQYVELYAKDPARFNKDFAAAFAKLLELGVPRS